MPRPLPLGEVARRRRDGEGKPAGGSRSGFPSYNLSVSLRSTAPLVGEPLAKPFTLRGLPRPPLARGGGIASAMTERLSPAATLTQAACPLSRACARQLPQRGSPWHVGQLSSGRAKHDVPETVVLRCLGQQQLDKVRLSRSRCPL